MNGTRISKARARAFAAYKCTLWPASQGECDWMPDIRVVLVMGIAVPTSDHASSTDADRKQRGVDLCGPCERC